MKYFTIILTLLLSSYCYADSAPVKGFNEYRENLVKANSYDDIAPNLSNKKNAKTEKYAKKLLKKKKYKTLKDVYDKSLKRQKYIESCLTYKKLLKEELSADKATLTFAVHDSCNEEKKKKKPKKKNIKINYDLKVILINENGWKFHKRKVVFE